MSIMNDLNAIKGLLIESAAKGLTGAVVQAIQSSEQVTTQWLTQKQAFRDIRKEKLADPELQYLITTTKFIEYLENTGQLASKGEKVQEYVDRMLAECVRAQALAINGGK